MMSVIGWMVAKGRSPHGERGLKCGVDVTASGIQRVALLMESVD